MGVVVRQAKAHPVLSSAVGIGAVVGLVVAWILISPLFIRTSLVEEATIPASAPVGQGAFNDIDAVHKGSGQAIVGRGSDGRLVVSLQNFTVTNGPDLYVYLSRHAMPSTHDQVVDGLELGKLKASEGAFSYETSAPFDPAEVKSVVIYCRAFRTIFSYATLG